MKFKFLLSTALITTLVACGGAEERKAAYMEKAKASIEAGDLAKASIELKNVLQIDPKDGEAYYQLGTVYEQQKEYRKAYGNYLKAQELSPEILDNQAKLGRLYLLQKDLVKAQEKVDFILSKEPGNTKGLLLKAGLLLQSDKRSEAMNIAKGVVAKEPDNVDAVFFVSSLHLQDKDTEKAIDLIKTALKTNNDNDRLNDFLASILISEKDYTGAEAIYKGFIKKFPDDNTSYNRLAALYDVQGSKEKAEEVLRSSIKAKPEDTERYLTLVTYINKVKGKDAAISEMKSAVANNSNIGKLRLALGELQLLAEDQKSAIDVYKKAITDFYGEVTAIESAVALSTLYYNQREYEKASEIVDDAIKISPSDSKLHFIKARLAIKDRDAEKAILSLRVVVKENPENIDAYLLLVNAYSLENNEEQVKNTLNTAYENNKNNPDSLLKLSKYYLVRDFDRAEKVIDSYNKLKGSQDYEGLSIKSMILSKKENFSESFELAEKLMELYPERPNGYLQAAPYYAQQRENQKAVAVIEKGYLNAKDNRKLLILLSTLQSAEKKFDIVIDRIKAEIKVAPEDAGLKLLLAKVYLSDNKISPAEALLNEAIGINANFEEPYLLLSQVYQKNKDLKSAKSILVRGATNVPASLNIPLKLASIYELDGNFNDAIDIFYKLNQLNPDSLVVVNNLASLLSDHGAGDAGQQMAKTLVQQLEGTEQPAFLDTIGWVYYKLGDSEKAIESLNKAVTKMPEVNVFNYHLGMAYKLSGDKALAKKYLEKSLADKKDSVERAAAEEALKDL